jgi:hypothetical protein
MHAHARMWVDLVAEGCGPCPHQVWAGSPARRLRPVEAEEATFIAASAANYSELAAVHKCEWSAQAWEIRTAQAGVTSLARLPLRLAVEQSKSFEEQYVETCIAEDRAALADPSNSVHQMWEYDAQVRRRAAVAHGIV